MQRLRSCIDGPTIDCLQRWTTCIHFLPMYKNESKISDMGAGDIFWAQSAQQ